ncbi:MAG TPA: IPTL-CTERM sorting domain-containing protein [Usitatibacter sp.]|nr:IPTL-CTERM sorting domain-containing protein [Usitatibacter sp.]
MRSTFAGILVALACASTPSLAQTYLGTAQPFAVLGATAVTCVVASAVTGDLGISPNGAGSITGYPVPPCTVSGTIHAADGVATTAQTDLVTAYNTLAALPCDANFTGQDLGSVGVLTPGVYCFNSSAQLTGTLTLNAQGNPAAAFVFKIGSTLTTASGSIVNVINGGSACGVSWQVGSSATLGTTTSFEGNIVALTTITTNTGASVAGRALARNGAVTLAGNASNACGAAFVGSGIPAAGLHGGAGIPTLSEWAMIVLAALLAIAGFAAIRNQGRKG